MGNDDVRTMLVNGGMFVLPVTLVLAVATFFGPGPALSSAVENAPVPVPVWTPPVAPESRDTLAAIDRLEALESEAFGPSPFSHGIETIVVVPETTDDPDPTPEVPGAPEFRVRVIMASDDGNTALIDGRTYREGDVLAGSTWYVFHIDVDGRSVTLRDPATGRLVTGEVK